MRDFYAFLHVCSLKRYKEIFQEMWEKSLPMIKEAKRFYIGVIGPGRLDQQTFPDNVEVIYFNENPETKQLPTEEEFIERSLKEDPSAHEFPTLDLIRKVCKQNECYVCYYHLRGVTSPLDNLCVVDQRHYMTYFNIEKYKDCLGYLEQGFDAVGVDINTWPTTHFSGNFWWSRSEHINTLLSPHDTPGIPNFYATENKNHRHRCEMWICSNPQHNYLETWNSEIHPSQKGFKRYPPESYRKV